MNRSAFAPPPPDRPLVLSLLLGVSGWFAGIFMLVVAALLFRPVGAGQAAVCGVVLLGTAWGLFMAARDGELVFVAQLALALSIAGQCLVLYAMSKDSSGMAPVAAAAFVLQAALALAMPNALHRTMSTFFATIVWALTLHFLLLGEKSDWRADSPSMLSGLGSWLFAWGPVAAALWYAIRNEDDWHARGWAPVVRPIVTGLIVGLAFATLASHPFESFTWLDRAQGDGALAVWPLLSALGALGALAAAFALRQRALMGVCIVAALAHVSLFYYALGASLLVKSLLMMAIGAAFFAAARALNSKETA